MDLYSVLGIDKKASAEEIKTAYRKLASKHHPDRGGDTAKFQEIQAAYDILSDPDKKAQYDTPQTNNFHFNFNNGGADINLDEIFNRFGFGNPFAAHPQFRQQERKNKDIKATIRLSLQEILHPQSKTLRIKTSDNQLQTVDIAIPKGVTSNTTIKYANLGDNMFTNLPRGDLYIQVQVINDTNFEVGGLDLTTNLTINCFEAILGSEQTVQGLDGKQFVIKTPPGCQPDTKLKILGEGLPAFQKDIKGSLYIRMKVVIPKDLSSEQIEQIRNIQYNQ